MIYDALRSFSEERYRYISRNGAVSERLSAVGGVPHIRASQMAIAQLIRSYESSTLYDLSLGDPTFMHLWALCALRFCRLSGTIQHPEKDTLARYLRSTLNSAAILYKRPNHNSNATKNTGDRTPITPSKRPILL